MATVNEFRLKDFYQAVVLLTMGFPLLRLDRSEHDFVTFVFDDQEAVAEVALADYWAGRVEANAKELISNIKELKTRIHTKMGD